MTYRGVKYNPRSLLLPQGRPRFFVWENVKGTFSSNNGEDFWAIIQAFANIGGYRLEWQLLNTKWFLPQNRERIYLVGYIGNGSGRQIFPITKNNKSFNELLKTKSGTKTPTQAVIAAMRGRNPLNPSDRTTGSPTKQRLEINKNGTSNTLTSVTKDNLVVNGVFYDIIPEIVKVRKHKIDIKKLQQFLKKHKTKSIQKISKEINVKKTKVEHWFRTDKSFAIPDVENWHNLKKCLNIKSNLFDKEICEFIEKESIFEKTNRVYNTKGISPTLTATSANERIKHQNKIRRLTPIECERLQGFPDNWTQFGESIKIGDTQRYKMCGNAVTVDVVEAVAKNIIKSVY